MKRKLIDFDVFQEIESNSLSHAEAELVEAGDLLATALDLDGVSLRCFGSSKVLYETYDGTFVHAHYKLGNTHVVFENVEELVIDEETERKQSKKILGDVLESLLDNNDAKASELFNDYMGLPGVRREMKEAALYGADLTEDVKAVVSKPTGSGPLRHRKQKPSDVAKRIRSRMKTLRKRSKSQKDKLKRVSKIARKRVPKSNPRARIYLRKTNESKLNEWATISNNVLEFVNLHENGHVYSDTKVRTDDKGNVTAVAVPLTKTKNEGKILSFNWKTLDHEIKWSRNGAKNLQKEATFVRAMVDLKKCNAVSDNSGLETTLENIVGAWPHLLLLTQDELADQIATALDTAGHMNYDDQVCQFMAEGILRKAHEAYEDKAKRIVTLSQIQPATSGDGYQSFKDVVDQFYPSLDESENVKYQVFADLYRALNEVYHTVDRQGDEAAKVDIATYMRDCEDVLNRQNEPDLELAESIAEWLHDLVETNLESEDWGVSNDVHTTISGDHPRMAQNARKGYTPASDFSGDWGAEMPVSDGKSYKGNGEVEKMKNSWANVGGPDTAPELTNPYTPKPFGDYKMKGEKSVVDDDNDFAGWQSGETWPNLQNPYVPKNAMTPQNYKMKSDNLIVDK